MIQLKAISIYYILAPEIKLGDILGDIPPLVESILGSLQAAIDQPTGDANLLLLLLEKMLERSPNLLQRKEVVGQLLVKVLSKEYDFAKWEILRAVMCLEHILIEGEELKILKGDDKEEFRKGLSRAIFLL